MQENQGQLGEGSPSDEQSVRFCLNGLTTKESDDVISSVSVLTGLSLGDVRAQLNEDFEELVIRALLAFKLDYYKHYLGSEEIVEDALDAASILESALDTVELELCTATEPARKEILKREADDLRASILREKNDQN